MIELLLALFVLGGLYVAFLPKEKERWVFDGRTWRLKALAFLILPTTAYAETVTLSVIHRVNSTRGLSRTEARQVLSAAIEQIRQETGVRVRVVSRRAYPVQLLRVPKDHGVFGPHHWGVLSSDALRDVPEPGRITLVISPRYQWSRKWWSAGQATVCGSRALAIVGRLQRFGPQRLVPAQTVIAHELGHALGAEHLSGECQMMHPSAGTEVQRCGWYLPFAAESVEQIRACTEGR